MPDLKLSSISPETQARFWAKVNRNSQNECWLWQGCCRRIGHGQFSIAGRIYSAAQIALVLSGHDQHDGLWALHSCDNPRCVNAAHLRWGTHRDNTDDAIARKRYKGRAGAQNSSAKLSEAEVRRIVELKSPIRGSIARVARLFKVKEGTISRIWNGQAWSSVTGLTLKR